MVTFTQQALDAWLAGFFLPFVRILALFSAAPLFSHHSIPTRARVAAAGVIALVVAPFAGVPADTSLGSLAGLGLVAQQLAIGVSLGFAARLVFAVFEMAGEFIGLQMGFSFAGFFNPQGGTESAVGSWLNTLAMLLFLSLNAHLLVLDALMATFRSLPIAPNPIGALAALRLDQLAGDVFRLGLSLALIAAGILLGRRRIAERLPALEILDDVMYKAIAVGFAFFTIATVLGALWAAEAWGGYWSWDPKETWALIVWLNYAAWLHMRLMKGLRGTVAAWWALAGLAVTTFAFLGVNMFLSGLHSYGTL